jgi:hypothetical protein
MYFTDKMMLLWDTLTVMQAIVQVQATQDPGLHLIGTVNRDITKKRVRMVMREMDYDGYLGISRPRPYPREVVLQMVVSEIIEWPASLFKHLLHPCCTPEMGQEPKITNRGLQIKSMAIYRECILYSAVNLNWFNCGATITTDLAYGRVRYRMVRQRASGQTQVAPINTALQLYDQ